MTDCEVLAAVAGATLSKENLGIAINYSQGTESIDAIWRAGQWLWVLRERAGGRIKGSGYCDSARDAIRTALTAGSFVAEVAPERETAAA